MPHLERLLPRLRQAGEEGILDELGAALARGRDQAGEGMLKALRRASLPADGLLELARWLAGSSRKRDQFLGAIGYPLTLAVVASLAGTSVVWATIGTGIGPLLASLGAGLPLPTRFVLSFVRLTTDPVWMWVFTPGVLALVIAIAWFGVTLPDRRVALFLPALGRYARLSATGSFCAALHALLRTGVPLPEAVDLAAGTVSNRHLRGRLQQMASQIRSGEAPGEVFRRTSVFPPSTAWRLWLAYYRSDIVEELRRAGSALESELQVLERRTTAFAVLGSWGLVLVVLAPIGLAVVALMMPMFSLISKIG